MRAWYIPSFSGDYRLEAHPGDADRALLTVEDPTAAEMDVLNAFLRHARAEKWLDEGAGYARTGRTELEVLAPVSKAGPILAAKAMPANPGTLTAVRSVSGEVTVTGDFREAAKLAESTKADAAATVRRATPCCPNMVRGAEARSSEVLKAFCTPRQWFDWRTKGYVLCRGGSSRHLYRIAHRHGPFAAAQGRICYDLTDHGTLHFHDTMLPAAEEVLSAMLVLQHREEWLRNEATCLGWAGGTLRSTLPQRGFHDVYRNPFPAGAGDGVPDTIMTRAFGAGALLGAARERHGTAFARELERVDRDLMIDSPGLADSVLGVA